MREREYVCVRMSENERRNFRMSTMHTEKVYSNFGFSFLFSSMNALLFPSHKSYSI